MENRLILASGSPRRKELLEQIGAKFEVLPAKGEEVLTADTPSQVVLGLSRQKAWETAGRCEKRNGERTIILGADTVVVLEDKILGKPKDQREAADMLHMLSGNIHSVFTGVTLILCEKEKQEVHQFYEETKVAMYSMSDEEITAYVETQEPMDKAGAYAIQGKCAVYVEKIIGDYYNVVGLPISRVYQELKKLGIELVHKGISNTK